MITHVILNTVIAMSVSWSGRVQGVGSVCVSGDDDFYFIFYVS